MAVLPRVLIWVARRPVTRCDTIHAPLVQQSDAIRYTLTGCTGTVCIYGSATHKQRMLVRPQKDKEPMGGGAIQRSTLGIGEGGAQAAMGLSPSNDLLSSQIG